MRPTPFVKGGKERNRIVVDNVASNFFTYFPYVTGFVTSYRYIYIQKTSTGGKNDERPSDLEYRKQPNHPFVSL